jgi:hypothetical protein
LSDHGFARFVVMMVVTASASVVVFVGVRLGVGGL